jgi:hypothetical protein
MFSSPSVGPRPRAFAAGFGTTKVQIAVKDVRVLRDFVRSPHFCEIVDYCRNSRTTLGVLQDAFHENVLSRMLRYLCSTFEDHGLGDGFLRAGYAARPRRGSPETASKRLLCDKNSLNFLHKSRRFLREWLKQLNAAPMRLGRGVYRVDAHFNWRVKSRSETNRYIDLVLVIAQKASPVTCAVLGVETKIDAPESEKQCEDYQKALAGSFPNVATKGLLYLTPDGKQNETGSAIKKCPVYDVSYDTLVNTCERLAAVRGRAVHGNTRRTMPLLRDLSHFLSKDLMKKTRRSQIDALLKKLENREETKRALDILTAFRYRPTIRSFIYERLLPRIREKFEDVEVAWHYPDQAHPNEFNFEHADVEQLTRHKSYRVYYMIYSVTKEPTWGDAVSVLLMAKRSKLGKISAKLRTHFNSIKEHLPAAEGGPHEWSPWTCLWASAEHRLGRFTDADEEDLFQLYKRTVERTKPVLSRLLAG